VPLIEVSDALITIAAQDKDDRRMLFIRVNRHAEHKLPTRRNAVKYVLLSAIAVITRVEL
jgi:hypothetical protein